MVLCAYIVMKIIPLYNRKLFTILKISSNEFPPLRRDLRVVYLSQICLLITNSFIFRIDPHAAWQHQITMKIFICRSISLYQREEMNKN